MAAILGRRVRVRQGVRRQPLARALSRLCTVTLTDRATGRPVEGATVTLSADMPSMPLAHSVPPAGAAGAAPGVYRGTLSWRWPVAG
jgi:hypothetical protein